jgi:hypothetical protein
MIRKRNRRSRRGEKKIKVKKEFNWNVVKYVIYFFLSGITTLGSFMAVLETQRPLFFVSLVLGAACTVISLLLLYVVLRYDGIMVTDEREYREEARKLGYICVLFGPPANKEKYPGLCCLLPILLLFTWWLISLFVG